VDPDDHFFIVCGAGPIRHARNAILGPPHAISQEDEKGDRGRQISRSCRRNTTKFEIVDLHILHSTHPSPVDRTCCLEFHALHGFNVGETGTVFTAMLFV